VVHGKDLGEHEGRSGLSGHIRDERISHRLSGQDSLARAGEVSREAMSLSIRAQVESDDQAEAADTGRRKGSWDGSKFITSRT
jgi:hypothetical protein